MCSKLWVGREAPNRLHVKDMSRPCLCIPSCHSVSWDTPALIANCVLLLHLVQCVMVKGLLWYQMYLYASPALV
jgi:hypothetical protein